MLAWLSCRGKTDKTQERKIKTKENESFWFRDFHLYGLESQTFNLFPHRTSWCLMTAGAAVVTAANKSFIVINNFCRK